MLHLRRVDRTVAKLNGGWPAHAAIRRGSSSRSRSPAARGLPRLHRAQRYDAALQPSNLAGHTGTVSLTGKVTAIVPGSDSHTPAGLQFKLHNINGAARSIPIVYHGSVPDLFKTGRDVNVTGVMRAARSSRPR